MFALSSLSPPSVFFCTVVHSDTRLFCVFPSHLHTPSLSITAVFVHPFCASGPNSAALPIGWTCYSFKKMGCARIGRGAAVVTRLKGFFFFSTEGFFLSATHVEQATNGTHGAERRTDTQTRSHSLADSHFLCQKTHFSV